ncbi:MAG: class C beta-lactamase-related serine hydrolase [Allomuricauda sp.]|nr:MAG: class C beta-lactamase-related serine hydrolase [Allomuricauda sp.]
MMKVSRTNATYVWLVFSILLLGCNSASKNNTNTSSTSNTTLSAEHDIAHVINVLNNDIKDGDYGLIDHFMLVHNGEVLADFQYQNDYETIAKKYDTTDHQYNYNHPDWHPFYKNTDLHTLQSVTKSVTSILMGIALDNQQTYTVDTKAMTFFSEYTLDNKDERLFDMTIEDLLTMRSGLKWVEGEYDDLTDDCIAMEASDDWIPFVLNKPFDSNPGEKFVYNSGVSVLIGKIVRDITGKKIDAYAEEVLFGPLGITEYYWKKTPKGEIDTEGGLYLKAQDLAKIGTLFLGEGKWNDKQVVPKDWVRSSINPKATNLYPEESVDVGYGYQWWTERFENGTHFFSANGYGGQFLMVVPDENIFVVFNGWNINDQPEKSTFYVLVNNILPALD